MKPDNISTRRLIWVLLSGACGLGLVVGLLLFARLPVRAKPVAGPTGAALTVDKRANTDLADAGDMLTYTISIEKAGADTTPAWLTDELPAELTYVTGSLTAADSFGDRIGTFGASNGVITWHEPSLAGPVWITFSAQVSTGTRGDIVNVVEVTGTGKLITDSWGTRVGGGLVYMPLIARRWPPIPYAPTLNEISNPNQEEDYTVSWTYGYTEAAVISYTLQEARNAGFTEDVTDFPVTDTSRHFSNKDAGTYYYRVRGHNTYGTGPWSNTRFVTVAFRDDFDDPRTGWEARRTSAPDISSMKVEYDGGRLITISDDNHDFGLFSPMVEAPSPPYQIRMRTRLKDGVYVPAYGIVFGAESGNPCPAERDNAGDANGCFYHYYRVNIIVNKWGGTIAYEVKRIDWHEGGIDGRGKAKGEDLSGGYLGIDNVADWDGWNDWWIQVHHDRFKLYVNGVYLGTYYDTRYSDDPCFGILTSNYEFAPAAFEHEYFYVEPIN